MKIDDKENIFSLLLNFRKKFKSLHIRKITNLAKFGHKYKI